MLQSAASSRVNRCSRQMMVISPGTLHFCNNTGYGTGYSGDWEMSCFFMTGISILHVTVHSCNTHKIQDWLLWEMPNFFWHEFYLGYQWCHSSFCIIARVKCTWCWLPWHFTKMSCFLTLTLFPYLPFLAYLIWNWYHQKGYRFPQNRTRDPSHTNPLTTHAKPQLWRCPASDSVLYRSCIDDKVGLRPIFTFPIVVFYDIWCCRVNTRNLNSLFHSTLYINVLSRNRVWGWLL